MRRAFTLIEILIVVLILGLIASMVIPQFFDVTGEAQRMAFVNSARTYVAAAKLYELDNCAYPDAPSGVLPDGFVEYIQSNSWESPHPSGGQWQARAPASSPTAAIGVRYRGNDPDNDPAAMQVIDEIVDDGDLLTGAFRRFGARRYLFIVAE